MPSLTVENYVKAIYQICLQAPNRPAATGQLAESLAVSPGTVTSMLKTLSDAGLVLYTPYEGVRLTESGRSLALRIVRRHRLIELFLVRTLDLTWDQVHEEAENMEHAVSDYLVDRIEQFLEYPEFDPHGDPIPKADGSVAAVAARALDQWTPGRPFRLVRVLDQSSEFLRRLSDLGLELGCTGCIQTGVADSAGLLVHSEMRSIHLSADEASKLLVTERQRKDGD